MAHRLGPLDADHVDELPDRCRRCLFWELGSDRPSAVVVDADAGTDAAARVRKQAWVTGVGLETGAPGVMVRDGNEALGYALFAPVSSFAPRGGSAPAASHDALLLATVWLHPGARGSSVGRRIVEAAIRDAIRLDLPAVEAYGDRRPRERDCVLASSWLLHHGFEVETEHPRYPLLRLDVRRAARWAESLEHAMEAIRGRVPRVTSPASPAMRALLDDR
jgi:GNAT superfamily N-acetyltransferase